MKRALSIAASDPSAASGVQLDLKVFARCGIYGTCAVTLLAAQDTYTVRRIFKPAPSIVGAQIDAAASDLGADACKIGWYYAPELTAVIAGRIRRRGLHPVVLDPCLWSERGTQLTLPRTVKSMVRELLPAVTVLTVTLREFGVLAGGPVDTPELLHEAAARLRALGPQAVVVEDAPSPAGTSVLLCDADGEEALAPVESEPLIAGSGTIFSAALTAALARGDGVREAACFAAQFLAEARHAALPLGKGLPIGVY